MSELLMNVGSEVADDVGRCAVAAGYSVIVGDEERDAGEWLRADAVVVDATAVRRLADSGVPRRPAVLLVCPSDAPPRVWQDALAVGVMDGFELPAEETRLVGVLTELRLPMRPDGKVVALVGGHGGAGATTLAAATGLAAVDAGAGRHVLLISPDEIGAGIDLMLGIEGVDGPRACDLAAVGGRLSHAALHEALPRVGRQLSVLAAGSSTGRTVQTESVIAAVDAGRVGGDIVVVDVPRTQPVLQRELLRRADLVVLLSQALMPALAATRSTREGIDGARSPIELVLRGPAPSGIPVDEMAWAVGAPLLASFRSDPSLPSRMESAALMPRARSPLGTVANGICRRLDEVAS